MNTLKYRLKNISPRRFMNDQSLDEICESKDPQPRSQSQMKYNLEEFFYNQKDDTKLLASINNDFSQLNDTSDKWQSMYKMISSKQNYSTLLINYRKQVEDNNKNYPFLFEKTNNRMRNAMANWIRRHTQALGLKNIKGFKNLGYDDKSTIEQVSRLKEFNQVVDKFKEYYSSRSIKKMQRNIEDQEIMSQKLTMLKETLKQQKEFQDVIREEQKAINIEYKRDRVNSEMEPTSDSTERLFSPSTIKATQNSFKMKVSRKNTITIDEKGETTIPSIKRKYSMIKKHDDSTHIEGKSLPIIIPSHQIHKQLTTIDKAPPRKESLEEYFPNQEYQSRNQLQKQNTTIRAMQNYSAPRKFAEIPAFSTYSSRQELINDSKDLALGNFMQKRLSNKVAYGTYIQDISFGILKKKKKKKTQEGNKRKTSEFMVLYETWKKNNCNTSSTKKIKKL